MTFLLTLARWAAFLTVVVGTIALAATVVPYHDPRLLLMTVQEAWSDANIEKLSDRNFVFALALLLVFAAVGLFFAFLMANVFVVLNVNWRARRKIAKAMADPSSSAGRQATFADNFDTLRQKIGRSWLLGHAFDEFCKTLLETDGRRIQSTVRPQVFFNIGLAREKLPGLKLMNAIPGYFVGVGLLLTFVGLVLALAKAGEAASAQNTDAMQSAMTGLLNIATFKFATSIAGLAASIVLSFAFRLFTIWIEASFGRLCSVLEKGLSYRAPQAISAEISATMTEQLAQLKDITQGDFFARMGQSVAPFMQVAIADAMAPVSDHIRAAVSELKDNSQTGMADMLQEFGRTLHGSAGAEMQALVGTLAQMQHALAAVQSDLRGSGEDFGRRMAEASEQLKRLVEEAGQSFGRSSVESRDALASVAMTLRETLERANADVAAGLGSAAGNASSRLEEAMGVVMGKLDGQISALSERLGAMQTAIERQSNAADQQQSAQRALLQQTSQDAAAVQARMQESLATTLDEVGVRLNRAVEQAVGLIGERFDAFSRQMRAVEIALDNQRSALEGTASEARKTADVFSATALDVRSAAGPLAQVGIQFSAASESMSGNIERSAEALKQMQMEVAALAGQLQATSEQTRSFWSTFEGKFDQVDTALGRAVTTLSSSTTDQSQALRKQVADVDGALGDAVGKLSTLLGGLTDAAESIADSLEAKKRSVVDVHAHEAL